MIIASSPAYCAMDTTNKPPPKFRLKQHVAFELRQIFTSQKHHAHITSYDYLPRITPMKDGTGKDVVMQQGWYYTVDYVRDSLPLILHESELKIYYEASEQSFDDLLDWCNDR